MGRGDFLARRLRRLARFRPRLALDDALRTPKLGSRRPPDTDTVPMSATHHSADSRPVGYAIAALVLLYLVALYGGWPQAGTQKLLDSHHDDHHHPEDVDHDAPHPEHPEDEDVPEVPRLDPLDEADRPAPTDPGITKPIPPPFWVAIPFVLLLLSIAVFPLLRATETWWESNLHRFYVAGGLACVTLSYYLFFHDQPVEDHWLTHDLVGPAEVGPNWDMFLTLVGNAIPAEYIPFMVLLFSLYVVCGGIRIAGNLRPTSGVNTAIMGVGALLASFIGTTGAAMLLIRLLLDVNRHRTYQRTTVCFFIFTVCNCGGLLLPIGDPPLFLGYLRGVPFLWTMNLLPAWLFVNCSLLLIYYLWDRNLSWPKEKHPEVIHDSGKPHRLEFSGLWNYNAWLLLGIVLCVALLDPNKAVPGTDWHPPVFMREVTQLFIVLLSLISTPRGVREANSFNYHAILEVAALFIGIFFCMQPALQIIDFYGQDLPEILKSRTGFFWVTGLLSSVLDNAPTYVVFFNTAAALAHHNPDVVTVANTGVPESLLAAISLGSVFMGAMTYIGNGPNFMVKAIAEAGGVQMPSFLGYMLISSLVLVPLLALMNFLLRHFDIWSIPLF